jgi:glycosyltransferase involved in cell wall biosynthesis
MKTDNSFKSDLFVSVVVPVHNAETYIDPFLHEVSVVLSRHFKDHEIIIVDNCSRDGTVGLVEKLQREIHNIQL